MARRLLVAQSAYDVVVEGVRRGKREALELGGSLLAYEGGEHPIILFAVSTGPNAKREPTRIQTDAAHQNRILTHLSEAYSKVAYVGDWHVHPMWMPELSSLDLETAGAILRTEARHRSELILLLGTARGSEPPVVLGFVARRGWGRRVLVESVEIERILDNGPEVTAVLGKRPDVTETDALLHEVARVRSTLGVEGQLWVADGFRAAIFNRGPQRATVLFPSEYPQGAPLVFAGSLEQKPVVPIDLLRGWSSLHDLAEPVEQALRPIEPQVLRAPPPALPALECSNENSSVSYKIRQFRERRNTRTRLVIRSTLLRRLQEESSLGETLYGTVGEDELGQVISVEGFDWVEGLSVVARTWPDSSDMVRSVIGDEVTILLGDPPRATMGGDPVEIVLVDPAHYADRIRALPGIDSVVGRSVVIVGLGSVGSDIATRLARLRMRVVGCDADILAVENLIRWGLPVAIDRDVGWSKAAVWERRIREVVPEANVEAHALDVVRGAARFESILGRERPSLLIAATDTVDSRLAINAAAARHGVPALFVTLSDAAASVRIELVEDAKRGPCHVCATRAEASTTPGLSESKPSNTPYASPLEPVAEAVAALPVDVAIGSALASRIALVLLSGGDPEPYFRNREQQGNVLFWSLHPDTWVFESPWDRLVYQVEKDANCPVCSHSEVDDGT